MTLRLIIVFIVSILLLSIIFPIIDKWADATLSSDFQTIITLLIKCSIITLGGYFLLKSVKK
jgi:hypothetical protein